MATSQPLWPSPSALWIAQWQGMLVGVALTLLAAGLLKHQPLLREHVLSSRAASQASALARGSEADDSLARSDAIHRELAQRHAKLLDDWSPDKKGELMLQELWELFGPSFPCKEKERFGDVLDGGKCLGSHGQTDFEEAVRGRYPHCNIHVYDPTISVEVAGRVADMTQATVHRKWIVAEEGLEEGHAAQAAHEGDAGNYTTLSREMKQLGTPWLNILKIDIEGSEWQVFDEFFRANATIPFSQILIELHVPTIPRHWGSDARHRLRYFFDGLARQGFRISNNEINLRCRPPRFFAHCLNFIEYTLVKTDEAGHVMFSSGDA